MKIDSSYNHWGIKKRNIQPIIIITVVLIFFISIAIVNGQKISFLEFEKEISSSLSVEEFKDNAKTHVISGKVTQTFNYCGGAAPPKQILDKLAIPVPYSGKKFYIRAGKSNNLRSRIVSSFITGKDGEFSIRLSPGIYSIIQEEQLKKIKASDYNKTNQQIDEKCLYEWWMKPYYILNVKNADIKLLNFNFHHPCFITTDIPCVSYLGPSPG